MTEPYRYSKAEIQRHLLVMLIRDFGYEAEPVYGHAPLRHQFAWMMATQEMSSEAVKAEVESSRKSAAAEGEQIPDPYAPPDTE